MTTHPDKPMTSRGGKRTLFILVPYVAVVLLLLLGEVALRLWYPSLANPLANEATYDGIRWYEINRGYLKKYFPTNSILVPELKPGLLRTSRQANTFRVFCLGESSMFGTPYQMTANIPAIVRKQLRHMFPGREIEVVNLAAAAINSNCILDLSKALCRFEPDLILVYLGHNEFYGPDGVGSSFLEKHLPFVIPFKYNVRDLRLVSLLLNILPGGKGPGDVTAEQNLMKQVSAGSKVYLYSDDAERIFRLFERNLRGIIAVWKEHQVPILVSDVSSNLMFPPFMYDTLVGQPASGLSFDGVLSDVHSGRINDAFAKLNALRRIDSTNAFVEYWLGRTCLARNEPHEAKIHLERARDFDLLKFRAPSRINLIIRSVCNDEHVPFVSTDSLFTSLSPAGIPGDDLFWEHLHPTVRGYYDIAGLFVGKINGLHLIPEPARAAPLPFHVDSLSICWLDLAYGDLSIQHLTGRWPFTDYRRETSVLHSGDQRLQRIVYDMYARKAAWDQGCYETAAYFWKNGSLRDAETTYEALLEENPHNFYAHYLLGNLLTKTGHAEEGVQHYRISIASNPEYPNSRLDLGLIEINNGDFEAAIAELTNALQFAGAKASNAMKANIYYGLSAAHANKGNDSVALRYVDEAIRLAPGYADALALRSELARQRQR